MGEHSRSSSSSRALYSLKNMLARCVSATNSSLQPALPTGARVSAAQPARAYAAHSTVQSHRAPSHSEPLNGAAVARFLATLYLSDVSKSEWEDGAQAPLGWHHLCSRPRSASELSADGGDGWFARNGAAQNRGFRVLRSSRVTMGERMPLIGETVRKESTVSESKELVEPPFKGNSLVTVRHEFFDSGQALLLSDERDFLFLDHVPAGDLIASAPREEANHDSQATEMTVTPDSVMLFRYSALTSNNNRIHYDVDFASSVGLKGIVCQSSLMWSLLMLLLKRAQPSVAPLAVDFTQHRLHYAGKPLLLRCLPMAAVDSPTSFRLVAHDDKEGAICASATVTSGGENRALS